MNPIIKTLTFALSVLLFSSYVNVANGQGGFNLNDPNNVYVDKDGKPMPLDSVKSFVSKGTFSMSKRDLENGKKEIRLTRPSSAEANAGMKIRNEWINKWMGKPFPDFDLMPLAGGRLKKQDLKGKVTVINFWFTGCQPCVAEMPQLNQLVDTFKSDAVIFLAFSFNEKSTIERFLQKNSFSYVQLPDSRGVISEMSINTYPTHIILDTSGKIREIVIGGSENIGERLKQLINKIKG